MFKQIKNLYESKVNRRLIVSKSGWWYLVFTILIGVFALVINNNILYLIESLLLSGLILSGIESEKIMNSIEFKVNQTQAIEGETLSDWIEIKNTSNHSLYCIEIAELQNDHELSLCFIPFLKKKETLQFRINRSFKSRGSYQWSGYRLSTSFPFGFAKKSKSFLKNEERIVWIAPSTHSESNVNRFNENIKMGSLSSQCIEGEVRHVQDDEDVRLLIPSKSSLGIGLFARNNRSTEEYETAVLDLTKINLQELEFVLQKMARLFYEKKVNKLTLKTNRKIQHFEGTKASLNQLSLLTIEDCK